MKIIVTRPQPDGDQFASLLQERGIEAVLSPMMTIRFNGVAIPSDRNGAPMTALAFTSANGVRAYLAQAMIQRSLPVFAVGKETASLCRREGFATVHEAGGDVTSLADLIVRQVSTQQVSTQQAGGYIGHIAGKERAGDLLRLLEVHSIRAKRFALYDAVAATALSSDAQDVLQRENDVGIVFFSPRTVDVFYSLLNVPLPSMTAYCLSDAIGEAVRLASSGGSRPEAMPRILVSKDRTSASLAAEIFNDVEK